MGRSSDGAAVICASACIAAAWHDSGAAGRLARLAPISMLMALGGIPTSWWWARPASRVRAHRCWQQRPRCASLVMLEGGALRRRGGWRSGPLGGGLAVWGSGMLSVGTHVGPVLGRPGHAAGCGRGGGMVSRACGEVFVGCGDDMRVRVVDELSQGRRRAVDVACG